MTTLIGCISDFSLGESLLSPEDIATTAKLLGYSAVTLTDLNLSSMMRFTKACDKAEIKPIIGAQLRIFDDLDRTPPKQRETPNREFRVNVFVKNDIGIKTLYKLLSLANDKEHFYYTPRLSFYELIDALKDKSLCIASGGSYSVFTHEEGQRYWKAIQAVTGLHSAFCELVAINTPYYERINQEAIDASNGSPFLLTRPALYLDKDQADTLDILKAITTNTEMSKPYRPIPFVRDLSILKPAELLGHVKTVSESMSKRMALPKGVWQQAWKGNQNLADQCAYHWSKQDISLPKMADDEIGELNRQLAEGWKSRLFAPQLGYQPTDLDPYKERLVYELGVIKQMGFVRYFLLVSDLVRWAKANGVPVGPGRGSASGSIISYLIGITDVDPIRFNLLFERFINPDRHDLPDVDIDFATSQRQRALDYLVEKYGEDSVAGITNFGTLASASALRDTCRIHGLDQREYDCSRLVPKESGKSYELNAAADATPEIDAFRKLHPDLWKHSIRLQGKMRSYGTHAAGVVVGGEPIINRAPVIARDGVMPTVVFDKREVESQGFVKLDCLGLSTLDVLRLAVNMIERNHGEKLDLLQIPLDDRDVLDSVGRGETQSVFQLEGKGMVGLLQSISGQGLTFDDIAAVTALYRPGPIQSGLLDAFVSAKNSGRIYYDHQKLEPALKSTLGVIIYQEQVSRVCQDLAGFSGSDADHVRRAMGRKDPVEMAKWKRQFIDGCLSESNLGEIPATQLFDKIEKFAGYAFNRSHSYTYSVISYQCAYLKVKFPAEFYAASMSIIDSDRLPDVLAEAEKRGITLRLPDINLSNVNFDAVGNELVAPFTSIKGISVKSAEAIVEAREKSGGKFNTIFDLLENVNLRRCHKGIQDVLNKVGALDSLDDLTDPNLQKKLETGYPWLLRDQSPLTERKSHQLALIPGLIRVESIHRTLNSDTQTRKLIGEIKIKILGDDICESCQRCSLAGNPHVTPRFGRSAKAMVVCDGPTWGEENSGKMVEGLGSEYVTQALENAGFSKSDFYWSTLIKSRKPKGKQYVNEQINACKEYLDREIEILQPGLIIGLGSATLKYLIAGSKYSQGDACKVEQVTKLNAAVLVGINPQSVYIDPSKQSVLNEVFLKAKSLLP